MWKLLPLLLVVLIGVVSAQTPDALEVGRFQIREPLGVDWPDEWITVTVTVDPGRARVPAQNLRVVRLGDTDGQAAERVSAQFYRRERLLDASEILQAPAPLDILCNVHLAKGRTARYRVLAVEPGDAGEGPVLSIVEERSEISVKNGVYEMCFDASSPLPINAVRCVGNGDNLVRFRWPTDVDATRVRDRWLERGPARAILQRQFRFRNRAHRYIITLTFRAGDPWVDVTDAYALGPGSYIEADLRGMKPDTVYHPHTYSARTFKPGGEAEDSTLQPPQHPIATLGPIWRDIWFGGGPYAFVYPSGGDCGVGFAAVRGSQWEVDEGVSRPSQNLFVHGDAETPGQVWVKIPTDGGRRHWAMVVGPPERRKQLASLTRARADIRLDTVLDEWVLDWDSDGQRRDYGLAKAWFGPFNRHELNPTTFPRRVRSSLARMLDEGAPIVSSDLAMLAYVFMDPNYWPGPAYHWGNVGNPNFHTDMYNVPLQIGLLMPDHPHAKRWIDYGVGELHGNLMRDSFAGGAWAESLSYSAFFFHVVDYAKRIRDAGVASPFRDWPRLKEVATYLACLHGPVDPRYGSRQRAPIGDTHPGHYIAELRRTGALYRGIDDRFADQLERFPEAWDGALDIGSREFYGFGAMLRGHPYDERHESFVTIKAGPARNHYQADELSFYFCSLGTPLALDYACHYSPRPWSASMHNRPDMNGVRPVTVGVRRAFARSEVADVFVADERTRRISHLPMEPHHTTRPGWEYPTTYLPAATPWTMRRYVMLVKHDPTKSRIADYLVVRDEIRSPEEVWWNLHMLARDIQRNGQVVSFPGQLDVDVDVHFISPALGEIQERRWGWSKERTKGSLRNWKGEQYEREHFGHTIGADFERGTWGQSFERSGEMGRWLRVRGRVGDTGWLVFLVPHRSGQPAPSVEKLTGTSARVSLGGDSEIVHLGTDAEHQAAVERDGTLVVLLKERQVAPWSALAFEPVPAQLDRGAR